MSTALGVVTFEDLPQDIKFDIFARLPAVKLLLRLRCVCKSWHTLISSPSFIGAYHKRKMPSSSEYILICSAENKKCFSLFSAETYDKCLDLELPTHGVGLDFGVAGSCHGLVCISTRSYWPTSEAPIYLWNPSIRKLRRLPEGIFGLSSHIYVAFGFQPGENDYKVVRIVREEESTSDVYQVEVYSLRLNSWRRVNSAIQFSNFFAVLMSWEGGVCCNGVIYKVVREEPTYPICLPPKPLTTVRARNCILAFDTSTEVFRKIELPNELGLDNALCVSRLYSRSSLSADIWVLGKDDTWKVHHTIHLPSKAFIASPLGFTANGGVHVMRREEEGDKKYLVLYDTKCCPLKKIEKTHIGNYVVAYTESLLLLN
ncbi:hypothetical protein ACLB2K_005972 [Fragaria x ananassa]